MLGEKIAKFRHELGLTQKTLAEKLHVTRQTVSKWEQGVSVPDAQMLQKIAENLNVNICDLLEIRLPQDTELEETLRNMAEDEKYRATHYRKVILCTVFLIAVLIVVVVCQMKTILNVREAMEQKFCTAVSSLLLNIWNDQDFMSEDQRAKHDADADVWTALAWNSLPYTSFCDNSDMRGILKLLDDASGTNAVASLKMTDKIYERLERFCVDLMNGDAEDASETRKILTEIYGTENYGGVYD